MRKFTAGSWQSQVPSELAPKSLCLQATLLPLGKPAEYYPRSWKHIHLVLFVFTDGIDSFFIYRACAEAFNGERHCRFRNKAGVHPICACRTRSHLPQNPGQRTNTGESKIYCYGPWRSEANSNQEPSGLTVAALQSRLIDLPV